MGKLYHSIAFHYIALIVQTLYCYRHVISRRIWLSAENTVVPHELGLRNFQ